MLLGALLPILMPILTIAALVILGLRVARMFSGAKIRQFDEQNRGTGVFKQREEEVPENSAYEREEPQESIYERPASVRDDEFWEQNHTVYDVPFIEAEPSDESEEQRDKN